MLSKNMKLRSGLDYLILGIIMGSTFVTACNRKLDDDGGYYDEKTKRYKYVSPSKSAFKKISLKVVSPTDGKTQKINGIVTRIGQDAKSFWLMISARKPYMILAESLASSNRSDKDKELRITLDYVSPLGSITSGKVFRKKWKAFVTQIMEEELLGQVVYVDVRFDEAARKFWGTLSKIVNTKEGERLRNINLWIVSQGLSYYFIDRGKSPRDKEYLTAQKIAARAKAGLWGYQ